MTTSLELLQDLFKDRPDTLTIFTLESLEADKIKDKLRNSNELFAANVNMYATGRTGAGKTALGNCLLSEKPVMKSTGYQDCTTSVGWFKLASNLRYYDLPGIGSDIECENINRVTLLIEEQLKDKRAKPPILPLTETDKLNVLDFSNCKNKEDNPEKEECLIGDWQSDANQKLVAPDVIIYVFAPDKQFLQPDKNYLEELLDTWKNRKKKCIVVTALNIFLNEDGSSKVTPQNMQDALSGISEAYGVIHENEWVPPIVEINSQTGKGIDRLTEIICQILPANQIGNMQTVLKDELKQYAEKERSNRYYRNLSLIAGRLSRYTVDKKIAGQSLLSAAASAISTYGVMTFKGIETVADLRNKIDDVVQQAEQIEKDRKEDIFETEVVMGTQEIKEVKPVYEDQEVEHTTWEPQEVKKTITEDIPVTKTGTTTLKSTQWVQEKVKREVKYRGFAKDGFKDITRTEYKKDSEGNYLKDLIGNWIKDEEFYEIEESVPVEKETRQEVLTTSTELRKITKDIIETQMVATVHKKIEQVIVGYEEHVVGEVNVAVGETEKFVGTKYLSGGYPAIQLLLGIGLGVQNNCRSTAADWQVSLETGKMIAERMLLPYKSKIEQLVENPEGENELVKILETALIGANSPTALGGK